MPSFTKRHVAAVLLTVVSAIAALGTWRAHLGCGGATVRGGTEKAHADVVDGGAVADGGSDDAGADGGDVACTPVVIDVRVAGSYTHDTHLDAHVLNGPSLVADHLVPSDSVLQAKLRTTVTFALAWPSFAAAYSIRDLCSTEEATPAYHRFACLDIGNELKTIEYRIEHNRVLVILEDGKEVARGDGSNAWFITPMPRNACASLTTQIPKRDLNAIKNAHINDSPSERCRAVKATRHKVKATLVHEPLPKGHDFYEMGRLRRTSTPPYRNCRSITQVRLVIPPSVAPSQDLGLLSAQCEETCDVTRDDNPRSVSASCFEGGKVQAYQLGDGLYVVEKESVRHVPLPCGVELDFRIADFAAQLGLSRPTE